MCFISTSTLLVFQCQVKMIKNVLKVGGVMAKLRFLMYAALQSEEADALF